MASGWVKLCKERAIPVADDFSLERVLAEPVTVRQWQLMGLPADEFSTENGMLTTMGRRWPLMIDPQGQANRWIRSMYADANLQVGDCVRVGWALRRQSPACVEFGYRSAYDDCSAYDAPSSAIQAKRERPKQLRGQRKTFRGHPIRGHPTRRH